MKKRTALVISSVVGCVLAVGCSDTPTPTEQPPEASVGAMSVDAIPSPGSTLGTAPAAAPRQRAPSASSASSSTHLTGIAIAYDMSHNSGRQALTSPSGSNLNSTIFGDFTTHGATITEITTFTAATLSGFDVLWLEEDFNTPLSLAEKTVLGDFVSNGGGVIICCEDWAIFDADVASPFTVFGFDYTSPDFAFPGLTGTTSQIADHPLTDGVASIAFAGTLRALTLPPEATALVSGSSPVVAFRDWGDGAVVAMADEFCVNATVVLDDNRTLCNQLMEFAAARSSFAQQTIDDGGGTVVVQNEEGEDIGGIDIPEDALGEGQNLTFALNLETDCSHEFLLGQVAPCLDIDISEDGEPFAGEFAVPIIVGLCVDAVSDVIIMYRYEETDGAAEAGKEVPAPFLPCNGPGPSPIGLNSSANPIVRVASRMLNRAKDWIVPRPLVASVMVTHRGFGREGNEASFFGWAHELAVDRARVTLHPKKTDKDQFNVEGVFDHPDYDGFTPPAEDVTILFDGVEVTISGGDFTREDDGGANARWVYNAPGNTGEIERAEIFDDDRFKVVGARVDLPEDDFSFIPFYLQIGDEASGAGLEFDSRGRLILE